MKNIKTQQRYLKRLSNRSKVPLSEIKKIWLKETVDLISENKYEINTLGFMQELNSRVKSNLNIKETDFLDKFKKFL